MEGDWSSREGRLPRLDREGRTLSDSDYCLPSPPERDLSTIHLSQVSLDGGYGGDVSSETGSSEVFHHCQQPSYAHSEGYYSYVSSTDSITPFIDRLKRELEFTEVQENSSSASSHGGTSVKWEESDTDTFVAPRERSTNKIDSDSVWHFRGSSGDLVNTSSRTGLTNSSSRLASPPLSSDSSRLNYLSRAPLFHNASYESVNIDHATRLSSQSHVAPTGVTHTTRSQTGHGCTTTNSKATRMQANHCRSCDVAYTGRLQPSLGLEPSEIPYPVRLHSNGSACDNSGSERVQQSNNVIREHSNPRANKAQPQLSHSSRIQTTHSSNNESNNTSSNRIHSADSTNHTTRINSNQNQSPHHASRIATSLSDTASHSSRHHSNHSDSSSLSSGVHTSHTESSSHTTRAHSVQSQSSTHTSVVHSNHGDPPNISNRLHSIHNESSSHSHSNKIFTIGEPPNITHSTRMHPTHCDSSSNHSSRIHSNHNDASVLNNSSRVYSSRGSSADFIGLSHSTRSHSSRSSSCEEVNQDHMTRHSVKNSSTESSSVSHPSRMHTHSSHSSSESSTTTHPTRVHSHSSISSESSNGTHPSRIHSHSGINNESSNTTHPSRVHSHSSLGVSESSSTSHPSRIHSHSGHTANSDSTTTNSHSSRMNTHSIHGTSSESVNSNHPTRIHSHSSLGVSEPSNTSHPSRKHSNSSHSISGESTNSNHPSRIHSHSSLGNESVSTTHSSRIHSHSSASSEPINTSLPSRIYTHSSHSVSNESANIARSSRVPPPQRHLSQSVLYLSADHRKLFPISTYQPEPPRVVGAVSVSERVVELENRLGGLKALQKKALLSFYQRHQASAPAPPPPPRRASSASDYLQLKGCIESSSTTSGSSQGSNGHKESTTSGNSNTNSTSGNSLLKEARQLHRSCGSLSGLSGPVIVGRSLSVDDWVPARPPKGAHLRQAAPKQPSPEPPPAHTPRPTPSVPTNTHQSSSQPCVATPLSQSPEKLSGSHRLNNPPESVRSGSQRNPPRAPSPEPPPPPPSPPQQYSDEPLPPPPGPDELPAPPLSLVTRHPSPGPQVPTHQSDSYQRPVSSELKAPSETPVPSTRSITNIETKPYIPEDLGSSNTSLDIKPQKLSENSTLSNNSSASDLQLQYNLASSNSDKICRDLLESLSSSTYDNRNKHTTSPEFSTDLNCKTERSNSSEVDKKEQIQRNSPLNHRKDVTSNDAQSQFKASCADLIDLETTIKSHPAVHSVASNPTYDLIPESRTSPLSSSPVTTPPQNHLPTEVKYTSEPQPTLPRKVTPDIGGVTDKQQFNHCAIDLIQDIPIQQSPPKIITRNISRDNLCQPKPTEKVHKNEDAQEEPQTQEVKKLLRKTSFRCSERIQQSITTLQNSIRSSSPQKFQESQKELLYKDLIAKDILPKDLLKDILSKDPLAKEIFSNEIDKDILSQDSSKQSLSKEPLSKDFLTLDIMSKDSLNKEVSSKDPLSKGVITDKYCTDLVTKDIITKEIMTKELSTNGISEDRWTSTIISTEASPSKLSLSLTRLDHIDITEKLISSFTSQKCGGADEKEDAKLDNLSDCDLEKSCSMLPSQLDPSISVGSLQQKKEELVTRLSRKLSVLRSEAAAVAEETSANEELGEAVVERVSSAWGAREASRLRSHVADLGRLTALLLTLTTRLARADNALLALSSCHPDKGALETKRDRLAGQLEEARRLKEKVDRRNEAVTSKLRERLTSDEFSDFMHFVSLKSKLLLDSREIADKIKLGEEQLQALQMTLSAVT